jgi:hypothetical protein
MDRASIEKTLGWMKPPVGRRVQGRRVKVYVASLDMNFYLKNPSGRRLATAMLVRLALDGVTCGWKNDAEVWPRDVHLPEIGLMKLARSQPRRAHQICR